MLNDSKYYRLVKKQSSKMLVIFSSANVPAGKFSGGRSLRDVDANLLWINCPNNNWYLKSIPGLGESTQEISENINKLIEETNSSERVLFYGGSMGGVGAAFYGALRRKTEILATGAELLLGINGGQYNKECKDKVENGKRPHLTELIKSSQSKFTFISGEECTYDLKCVSSVNQFKNTSVYSIINGEHVVPHLLHREYGMENIIRSYLDGKPFDPIKKMQSEILLHPELIDVLYRFEINDISPNDFFAFEANLNESVTCPFSKSYWLHRKAFWLMKQNKIDLAIEDLRIAVKLNGDSSKIHTLIGQCYWRKKDIKNAKKHVSIAIAHADKSVGTPNYNAFFIMLEILQEEANRKDYLGTLTKLQEILPERGPICQRANKYAERIL